MEHKFFSQSISPGRVIRGEEAWLEGKKLISNISRKPILLGRSKNTSKRREILFKELESLSLKVTSLELKYDCCEIDLERIQSISSRSNCDSIIATGGGKVLDAGKIIAERLNLPCITIPLSSATCAGWSALSNIYSSSGSFIKDIPLKRCPDILIFDHSLIREAPPQTLASGIADALAKWYESSISSGSSADGIVQQAVQMARVLRDQILIDGLKAYKNNMSDQWIRTAEGCALSAGLVGGIGGSKCRTAAAHALHNGLTQLQFRKKPLHGELVGFGIIVQLKLEEKLFKNQLARQARIQLQELLRDLNIPLTLNDLGLSDIRHEALEEACLFSCRNGMGIENLPFHVSSNDLLNAMKEVSEEESNFLAKKKVSGKIN